MDRLLASRSVFSPAPRILLCRRGGPERLVLGLVVAAVLERVLGDHRPGKAQAGGALELPDAVLDVVHVDHRDALEPGPIGAAELGEPVVVRAEDRRHQRRVRHPEVEQALRGVQHLAGHAVEPHVGEVLLGVVASAMHVLEAGATGDRLGSLEARAGVRDEPDAGQDLVGLDDDLVGAVDPLHPRAPRAERRVDAGGPQVRRLEHVRVGREDQRGQHRMSFLYLKAGSTSCVRIWRLRVSSSGGMRPPGFSSATIPSRPSSSRNRVSRSITPAAVPNATFLARMSS